MKKYLISFLLITVLAGCSVVSKQYYYVPVTAHQTIKSRAGYFKMVHSQFPISDSSNKPIGDVSTSNGIGVSLLAGPPYLPVLPVGLVSIFYKGDEQFIMDIEVTPANDNFLPLAIDSNSYKKTRDSLNAIHIMTARPVNTSKCYMIVNGSKKVPLQVEEFFMGSTRGHSYRMSAAIRFGKVRTVTIVTGNPLIDYTLKNVTFRRNSTITYCVMGLS